MKKKGKKYILLAKIILGCILITLSLKFFHGLVNHVLNPIWDGKTNLAIAVKGKNYFLFFLNPSLKRFYIIKLPDACTFPFSAVSGGYKLESVWNMGKMEKKEKIYLRQAISRFFGVPVSGYLVGNRIAANNADVFLKNILLNQTNLSLIDYFRIKYLHADKITIDLKDRCSDEQIDKYFERLFKDLYLARNKLNYKIEYSAPFNQEFKYFERLILSTGGKVSDVEFSEGWSGVKKNQCVLKEINDFDIYLKKIFNCDLKYDHSSSYDVTIKINSLSSF